MSSPRTSLNYPNMFMPGMQRNDYSTWMLPSEVPSFDLLQQSLTEPNASAQNPIPPFLRSHLPSPPRPPTTITAETEPEQRTIPRTSLPTDRQQRIPERQQSLRDQQTLEMQREKDSLMKQLEQLEQLQQFQAMQRFNNMRMPMGGMGGMSAMSHFTGQPNLLHSLLARNAYGVDADMFQLHKNEMLKKDMMFQTGTAKSACAACYRSKLACDKRRPCFRCIKAGRECVSRPPVKLGRPRKPRGEANNNNISNNNNNNNNNNNTNTNSASAPTIATAEAQPTPATATTPAITTHQVEQLAQVQPVPQPALPAAATAAGVGAEPSAGDAALLLSSLNNGAINNGGGAAFAPPFTQWTGLQPMASPNAPSLAAVNPAVAVNPAAAAAAAAAAVNGTHTAAAAVNGSNSSLKSDGPSPTFTQRPLVTPLPATVFASSPADAAGLPTAHAAHPHVNARADKTDLSWGFAPHPQPRQPQQQPQQQQQLRRPHNPTDAHNPTGTSGNQAAARGGNGGGGNGNGGDEVSPEVSSASTGESGESSANVSFSSSGSQVRRSCPSPGSSSGVSSPSSQNSSTVKYRKYRNQHPAAARAANKAAQALADIEYTRKVGSAIMELVDTMESEDQFQVPVDLNYMTPKEKDNDPNGRLSLYSIDGSNKRKNEWGDAFAPKAKKKRGNVHIGTGGVEFDLSAEGGRSENDCLEIGLEEQMELLDQPARVRFAMLMTCEIARSDSHSIERCPRFYLIIWSLFSMLSKNTKKLDFVLLLMQVWGNQVFTVFPDLSLQDSADDKAKSLENSNKTPANLSLTVALPPVVLSTLIDPEGGECVSVQLEPSRDVDMYPIAVMRERHVYRRPTGCERRSYLACNSHMQAITGYTSQELTAFFRRTLFFGQVVLEQDWPIVVRERVNSWRQRTFSSRMVVRIKSKSGTVQPILVVFFRLWGKKRLHQVCSVLIPLDPNVPRVALAPPAAVMGKSKSSNGSSGSAKHPTLLAAAVPHTIVTGSKGSA